METADNDGKCILKRGSLKLCNGILDDITNLSHLKGIPKLKLILMLMLRK